MCAVSRARSSVGALRRGSTIPGVGEIMVRSVGAIYEKSAVRRYRDGAEETG
jgi:hypothetical protein